MTDILRREDQPAEFALSDREWQVMLLSACGLTPTDIAKRCFLSVKTVGTYRERVLQKTGLNNFIEVAIQAHQQGIIGMVGKRLVVIDPAALNTGHAHFYRNKKARRADIPTPDRP